MINYFIYEFYSNRNICFIEIEFVICYFFVQWVRIYFCGKDDLFGFV